MITKFDGYIEGPWQITTNYNIFSGPAYLFDINEHVPPMYREKTALLASSAPSLLDRLKAMYGMLKLLEHCDIGRCPVCSFTRKNGHVDNCELKFELILTEQLLGINQTEVKP